MNEAWKERERGEWQCWGRNGHKSSTDRRDLIIQSCKPDREHTLIYCDALREWTQGQGGFLHTHTHTLWRGAEELQLQCLAQGKRLKKKTWLLLATFSWAVLRVGSLLVKREKEWSDKELDWSGCEEAQFSMGDNVQSFFFPTGDWHRCQHKAEMRRL